MKKIVFIAVLGLLSLCAKAQTFTVTNLESCDITVTPLCFTPPVPCAQAVAGAPVTVPCCGGTRPVTFTSPCPAPPNQLGFEVCWSTHLCPPTTCAIVGVGNALCAPSSVIMPGCADCIQHGGKLTVSGTTVTLQ